MGLKESRSILAPRRNNWKSWSIVSLKGFISCYHPSNDKERRCWCSFSDFEARRRRHFVHLHSNVVKISTHPKCRNNLSFNCIGRESRDFCLQAKACSAQHPRKVPPLFSPCLVLTSFSRRITRKNVP